jgi:hypothetical protein
VARVVVGWRDTAHRAYDQELANRIRELLGAEPSLTEKAMSGGLAFLINGGQCERPERPVAARRPGADLVVGARATRRPLRDAWPPDGRLAARRRRRRGHESQASPLDQPWGDVRPVAATQVTHPLRRPLVCQQIQYSLLARAIEWEVIPAGLDAGLGTLLYGPLAQGWLTGKYRRDQQPPAGTRVARAEESTSEAWHRRNTEEVWTVIDELRDVAHAHGVTPGQAALAWVADRPGVTAPIVGARTVAQLRESLAAAALHLDEKAATRLTEVSAPLTPNYPYQMMERIAGSHG